jgi:hypothetical protein
MRSRRAPLLCVGAASAAKLAMASADEMLAIRRRCGVQSLCVGVASVATLTMQSLLTRLQLQVFPFSEPPSVSRLTPLLQGNDALLVVYRRRPVAMRRASSRRTAPQGFQGAVMIGASQCADVYRNALRFFSSNRASGNPKAP